MNYKVFDKVRLTKQGIKDVGHYFKDNVYEDLEIVVKQKTPIRMTVINCLLVVNILFPF